MTDTTASLADVVTASVGALELQPADAGAAALAITYARMIDVGGDPSRLGPPLLAVLDALLMTPRARSRVRKAAEDGQARTSPLDELQRRREQRAG